MKSMLDWRHWTMRGLFFWFVFIWVAAYALSKIADNSSLPDGVQFVAGFVQLAVVVFGIVIMGRSYSAWAARRKEKSEG
jgi:hypothetical protein